MVGGVFGRVAVERFPDGASASISAERESPIARRDVLQTGANDVYVVEMENKEEVLIPAIGECILAVELEERKMYVHLLKGLL